jgi:hypothetical protein
MYCNKCGKETNDLTLCQSCSKEDINSTIKTTTLSDIDINSLSEKLIKFGLIVSIVCVVWWANTYSFAKTDILNFTRCLYSNDAMCSLSALLLNGTSSSITYNYIFLWIGVISLIIGKLFQPKANTSKNIQTFISSINFDEIRNKIIYYNYKKQINKILSFLHKNKLKSILAVTILIVCSYPINYYYEYYTARFKVNDIYSPSVCKTSAYKTINSIRELIAQNPQLSDATIAGINDEKTELIESCFNP